MKISKKLMNDQGVTDRDSALLLEALATIEEIRGLIDDLRAVLGGKTPKKQSKNSSKSSVQKSRGEGEDV